MPKTTFRTHDGHNKFLVMSFIFDQCTYRFYESDEWVFKPFLDLFVLVCIDDTLVYLKREEDHADYLRIVLGGKQRLYANFSKCEFL